MTYNWNTFVLEEALAGAVVGFQQTNAYDLSMTGKLIKDTNRIPNFKVNIAGTIFYVNENGKVVSSIPTSDYVGRSLEIVTAVMGDEGSIGTSVTRSGGSSGEGRSATAVLSTMEPRDHFAMNVLNAMLIHAEQPQTFDDATMLMYSRAAYKWAQAMMIAAADSREGESTTPSHAVDINSGDLQSNMEKLLYNICEAIKAPQDNGAVKTKFVDTPSINIANTPSINIANTPSVNVVNTPTVEVSNMPSEPIEVTIASNS